MSSLIFYPASTINIDPAAFFLCVCFAYRNEFITKPPFPCMTKQNLVVSRSFTAITIYLTALFFNGDIVPISLNMLFAEIQYVCGSDRLCSVWGVGIIDVWTRLACQSRISCCIYRIHGRHWFLASSRYIFSCSRCAFCLCEKCACIKACD